MLLDNKNGKTMLSDKVYAFGKKLVQLFLPAISALYFGLAKIWGLPDAEEIVGSIAVITTFFGAVLRLSSAQYDASGAAFDGTVTAVPHEDGTAVHINVDTDKFVNADKLTLKVVGPTTVDTPPL